MMYAFAARGDCAVWDEPFYAAYLAMTGLDHPMRAEILAAQEIDPMRVAAICAAPTASGQPLFYQKHMTHHMIRDIPLSFMEDCTNVFLIRHPSRVIASYVVKRERPTFEDLGFAQQAMLFDRVADRSGQAPVVIDSADIRADPRRALTALCAALGIGWTDRMLSWPAGPKPYDGAWAPHWYGAVHRSTGFDGSEGPMPDLPDDARALADAAAPHYERLARHRLTP